MVAQARTSGLAGQRSEPKVSGARRACLGLGLLQRLSELAEQEEPLERAASCGFRTAAQLSVRCLRSMTSRGKLTQVELFNYICLAFLHLPLPL